MGKLTTQELSAAGCGRQRKNSLKPSRSGRQASVVSHKSLDFGCHSERSEESRLFKYMRPFTEPALRFFTGFTLRSFTSFRMTDEGLRMTGCEGFRVTRKTFFSILLM